MSEVPLYRSLGSSGLIRAHHSRTPRRYVKELGRTDEGLVYRNVSYPVRHDAGQAAVAAFAGGTSRPRPEASECAAEHTCPPQIHQARELSMTGPA